MFASYYTYEALAPCSFDYSFASRGLSGAWFPAGAVFHQRLLLRCIRGSGRLHRGLELNRANSNPFLPDWDSRPIHKSLLYLLNHELSRAIHEK